MTLARTFPIRPAALPGGALDSRPGTLTRRLNVRLSDGTSQKARTESGVALAARRITTRPVRRTG
jgi:hypothetical protein